MKKKMLYSLSIILTALLFIVFDNSNTINAVVSFFSTNSSLAYKLLKISCALGAAALSYLSVSLCLLSRGKPVPLLGIILFFSGLINALAYHITGSHLNPDHILVAVQNMHYADLFITATWKLLVLATVVAAVFLFPLHYIRRKLNGALPAGIPLLFVLVALGANIFYAVKANPNRSPFYAYALPIVCVKTASYPNVPYVPRNTVAPKPSTERTPDLIVLIIDESVTYEALRSYGSTISRPGEMSSALHVPVLLYKAHAAGNHSAIANYVLRLGLDRSAYPDNVGETLAAPTIFSYAKAAGYTTVLYDAQAEDNQLQNLMSQFDLTNIDTFSTAGAATKRYLRDAEALNRLKPLLTGASPEHKVMAVIVKHGVHFPYVNSVPDRIAAALPSACRSSDTTFSSSNQQCNRIQYEAALKYSVDGFMDMLFKLVQGKDFAIVYTADHGQNIYSRHAFPHGSLENVSECEISVPILLAGRCFSSLEQTDKVKSHFQIPGTLLSIMSFSPGAEEHQSTLWDTWDNDGTYLHELFGDRARWLTVESTCEY
jgi:glucan phosphoethanolaminetransferase (alkaline phosphatase superfamily)